METSNLWIHMLMKSLILNQILLNTCVLMFLVKMGYVWYTGFITYHFSK